MDTQPMTKKNAYLDALDKRVLVFDGAMGTTLQSFNLTTEDYGGEHLVGCNDALVLVNPQVVLEVHRNFLKAGADVIETNTFRANRLTLADYGLQDRVLELNEKAASIARQAANEFFTLEKPRFVAGSMGPSGKLISTNDPEMSDITFDELKNVFREQAIGLIRGGVDLLLIETSNDILEVKAAINGIREAQQHEQCWLPIQAQVTLDVNGKMLLGTDITAVLAILEGMDVNAIGLNCSTGPEHMRESIKYLTSHSRLPISVIPNAGLPLNIDGLAVYPLAPAEFSGQMGEYVYKYGIRVVGGCCGTRPEHIEALSQEIAVTEPFKSQPENEAMLASAVQAVPIEQQPAPFIIGERMNAQGSKAFKRLLLAEDFDAIMQVARDQMDFGAHGLDISVATTERSDEADLMRKIVKRLSLEVPVPLVIDTTEVAVAEAALQTFPGRSLINSTNLESGEEKAGKIFTLARKYSAAVLCLTIDEEGMAKTAERKLAIARRMHNLALQDYHLRPQDLVFDPLTFTLATGEEVWRDSALETLKGIQSIKTELPGVHTCLGVSNISFGLAQPARKLINSVFLHHAVESGLDMAIVNPAHIRPYGEIPAEEKQLAEDLIFNRSADALEKLVTWFELHAENAQEGAGKKDPFEGLSARERLFQRVLLRQKNGLEEDIDQILTESDLPRAEAAVEILNQVLLPAMKEIGDRFGSGELILPFVLQSAEVMKKAVTHLEQYLDRQEGLSKGKIVLATVYGDVHDIGKNLVRTILANNGYEVIDLGKQVTAEEIISRAVEEQADAVGLSALLVSTSKQMPLIANEFQRRGIEMPILIGGAAINPQFAERIASTAELGYYSAGIFYCKDAFDGLNVMDQLVDPQKKSRLQQHQSEAAKTPAHPEVTFTPELTRNVPPAEVIPHVEPMGVRIKQQLPFDDVAELIDLTSLYRLNWGAKHVRGQEWQELRAEFDRQRFRMLEEAKSEGWIQPQSVYGYFPVWADGNDLVVFDSLHSNVEHPVELTRFNFPRQKEGEGLCLSDYFLPFGSPRFDILPLQVVTVGKAATQQIGQLDSQEQYSEGYFLHGLAVQMAEATAEYIHSKIRAELGIGLAQGFRYSWGYPALPWLREHRKVFDLLPVEKEFGMSLTSAWQLVPEQSTAAMVVHHPLAKPFDAGVSRMELLFED
ncbi:MAG: methionine synthase [Anaerolineaceae bacterium]|nr:methionine synthase [Anaerolineaceae bacterium]MDD4043778.1 methionine synthase [Anaerolineaceae bacterium]